MNHTPRILIAEDESIIARDIEKILIKLGYQIAGSVRSGKQVLEAYNEFIPDLILMDINLQGTVSGIEVTKELKKIKEVPVIYLTALADNNTINEAKFTEPFGYIVKPFDEDTLRTTIEMGLYKFKIGQKLREKTHALEDEKTKSDKLLRDILPSEIIDEFKSKGTISPKLNKDVTIIFTDFEDFTSIASGMKPVALVTEINEIFMNFDMIIDKYRLEKLKTIGDSYMIASGIPQKRSDHADAAVEAALEMLEYLAKRNKYSSNKWRMRVGIHSGEVIAGVVGKIKYTYDVWGQTVSIAKNLEEKGLSRKINVSESVKDLLDDKYLFEKSGVIDSGHNHYINTYFVSKVKSNS